MLQTPVALSPGAEPPVLLNRTLSGTHSWSGDYAVSLSLSGNEPWFSLRKARSLVKWGNLREHNNWGPRLRWRYIKVILNKQDLRVWNGLHWEWTGRLRLKCDGTRAETRFRLPVKRTSPFKSAGASVQSTTGSRGVRISGSNGSNAGYAMFRCSAKGTGYPLHSQFSPSLPLPCVTVCHHVSTGLYQWRSLVNTVMTH